MDQRHLPQFQLEKHAIQLKLSWERRAGPAAMPKEATPRGSKTAAMNKTVAMSKVQESAMKLRPDWRAVLLQIGFDELEDVPHDDPITLGVRMAAVGDEQIGVAPHARCERRHQHRVVFPGQVRKDGGRVLSPARGPQRGSRAGGPARGPPPGSRAW